MIGIVAVIATTGWVAAVTSGRRRALRLARTVHEVRGALTVIGLGLELGVRAGRLPPERLAAIEQQVRRAGRALDTLDGDRSGRREALAVGAAVRALTAVHPGVDVEVDGEPQIDADPGRFAQVLGNLVANAVEHGIPPVRVRVTSEGALARIEVSDGGPGLPAPLVTLAARSRPGRRRGHGLAIAVAAARADGGHIRSGPASTGARLVVEYPCTAGEGDLDALLCRGGTYVHQRSADGWSSGTTGSQPAASRATRDGGVRSSTEPLAGRAIRSV